MADLRERRHEATKQHLIDVAFAMFIERGFENVSMEEVSRAAGVSRSTAYRRFPTKEDVVLEIPRRWLVVFDSATDALPTDAGLRAAIRSPALAVAGHIDDTRDTVLASYAILDQAPTLQLSGMATSAWLDRLADVIDQHSDVDVEVATTIAGAYIGAIDAMMRHWAGAGGAGSVRDATARLAARLEPILPAARPPA